MKCQICNGEIVSDYHFCPWCGAELNPRIMITNTMQNYTLCQIYSLWSAEHYPSIDKSTIDGYTTAWKKRLSIYSNHRIKELKAKHYQDVIDEVVENGLSRSTAEKVKNLISELCQYAMKNDIIDKNYANFLVLPKVKKKGRDRFTDEEMRILWENTDDITVRIILIFAYTGLRANELFWLKREDVHLNEERPYMICGSKTEAGRDRTVMISPYILDFIKDAYKQGNDYLFSNTVNGPINLRNWRERRYYPTLMRLGIQRREVHCLRHTFASMMVKEGANPKSLTELMGHESISTTADIYAHADREQLFDAIKLLKKQ